jgi:adenine-specific DNA-methyltransferase
MNKTDLIQKVKALDGLTNAERSELIELINTEKGYGLVWKDKPEYVEEKLRTELPVLKEISEKFIPGALQNNATKTQPLELDLQENNELATTTNFIPNHVLIEGDNLHALTALSFTHEGKIDVIYIDPPYNTGNKDFKYHDAFKDEAEFIDKEHPFRHSTWLSFMSKRLMIAKRLLAEDGLIFISIDENECYQLKILCDEIFGSKNFITDHIWKSKSGGAGDASFIATDTENILLYAKNQSFLKIENDEEATVTTSYNRTDEDGSKYGLDRLDKQSLGYLESLDFPIEGPDGVTYIVEHKDPVNKVARWRWAKDTVEDRYDELVFENGYVYTKNYEKSSAKPRNLLIEQRFGRTRTGKTELFSIIGPNDFSAPKPSRLISYLVKLYPKKDAIVLDFFAGSGTTLQAVMHLNNTDGGIRKCIICTNNENKICESVTYPRAFNIIKGYQSKGNSQVELHSEKLTLTKIKNSVKLLQKVNKIKADNANKYNKIKIEIKDNSINVWGEMKKGEAVPGYSQNNLRYYRTDFVPSLKSEENRRKLTQSSTDLLCIKEDCYTDLTEANGFNIKQCRIFTNDVGKYLIIVYHSRQQIQVCEQLAEYIKTLNSLSEKVRLYGFSPEKETLTEDFIEVADKIEAVPLPDSIYNAYRATFKAIKLDKKPPASINVNTSELENNDTLFNINQDEA